MLAAARHGLANEYPDDDSTKEVVLQADGLQHAGTGDRHVLMRWLNKMDGDGAHITQIVQLTGGPGNYNFFTPVVKKQSENSRNSNTFYSLGQYTRVQRDQIITLAKAVQYDKRSRVNSCRTWTRDLLEAMVKAGLLSQTKFEEIDTGVPLRKRVPELLEDAA
ncbi:uncharacterized protein LAESUDRAFT_707385 [Laetiporus sulphureus 93-53]|uniref:Uncharacterized protein n=1 Tax=Laetiporus sulphureus 93-53 TaxID=1314785 RepID=A0A165BQ61_9APHY|nr:uncharacterized protein LAESUDRAFT_707385 [Laetiporus sulphureus 93-53]KZT01454.1 hypothetical protein LAESUDRAFT_707385 [Laetiporus sulphureus 93-53]